MMRANTKLTIKQADIIIDVPLAEFGSLDWRRSQELIVEGYKAAEAMRDRLLPLAVSADEYTKWQTARSARRRSTLPVPAFSRLEGFSSSDERQLTALLARHIGVDFNADDASRPTSPCSPASIATRPSPGDSSRTPPAKTASWSRRGQSRTARRS